MEVNEGKIHLLRLLKLMKLICFMEQWMLI
jgi:hypothetical protein